MSTLADDLLRSKTIPELKDLIITINNEYIHKKTELQSMVGSKYHEFIQSADKITKMKELSIEFQNKVTDFSILQTNLIEKTYNLLESTNINEQTQILVHNYIPYQDINPTLLWTALNNGNIYEATKLILISNCFIQHINPTRSLLHSANYSKSTSSLNLPYSYIGTNVYEALNEYSKECLQKILLDKCNETNMLATLLLSETVAGDAKLYLLEDDYLTHSSILNSNNNTTNNNNNNNSNYIIADKAKLLAALSFLPASNMIENSNNNYNNNNLVVTNHSNKVLSSLDLLDNYLTASELRIKTLLHSVSFSTKVKHDNNSLYPNMQHLVRTLQYIIIDVYVLFLIPLQATNKDMDDISLVGLKTYMQYQLLFDIKKQLEYYTSNKTVNTSTTSNNDRKDCSLDLNYNQILYGIQSNTTTNNNNNNSNSTSITNEILRDCRKCFQKWWSKVILQVAIQCNAILALLPGGASEVAQLQQQVLNCCVNIQDHNLQNNSTSNNSNNNSSNTNNSSNINSSNTNNNPSYSYNQVLWEQASTSLLTNVSSAHITMQSSYMIEVTILSNQNASIYLWSRVFRACFFYQVERLLKQSCSDILVTTKQSILLALQQQGVFIDSNTLQIIPNTSYSDKYTTTLVISSPVIYQLAENIRAQFEIQIYGLLSAVVQNKELYDEKKTEADGRTDYVDSQSMEALARTLRTHCSQLVGHVFVLLRNLAEAIHYQLQSHLNISIIQDFIHCFHNDHTILPIDFQQLMYKYSGIDFKSTSTTTSYSPTKILEGRGSSSVTSSITKQQHTNNDIEVQKNINLQVQSYLSSLLFIGRISWLFKLRGQFLSNCLNPLNNYSYNNLHSKDSTVNITTTTSSNTSSTLKSDVGYSEDQFHSAFEIADTNGDNILNYNEVIEALQALSGGTTSTTSTTTASFDIYGLHHILTPALSYNEFALICGSHLLSQSCMNLMSKVDQCLDHILSLTHISYAVAIVNLISEQINLKEQLSNEFGLQNNIMNQQNMNKQISSSVTSREKVKPFKSYWKHTWVDFDNSSSGSSNSDTTLAGEKVLIPTTSNAIQHSFLHHINQWVTTSIVSIDTMQSITSHTNDIVINSLTNINSNSSSIDKNKNSLSIDIMDDPLDDLLIDDIDDMSNNNNLSTTNNNMNMLVLEEPGALLYIMTGSSAYQGKSSANIVLSYMISRVIMHIVINYLQYLYDSMYKSLITMSIKNTNYLEDISLQVIFDLNLLSFLTEQWNINISSSLILKSKSKNNKIQDHIDGWINNLDAISAELLLPLVTNSMKLHIKSTSLLFLQGKSISKYNDITQLKTNGLDSISTSTTNSSGKSNSDNLLSSIFPSIKPLTTRFVLLPLAINISPITTTTTSTSNNNMINSKRINTSSSNIISNNVIDQDNNTSINQNKSKNSVLNWWG